MPPRDTDPAFPTTSSPPPSGPTPEFASTSGRSRSRGAGPGSTSRRSSPHTRRRRPCTSSRTATASTGPALQPERDGAPVDTTWSADPATFRWASAGGVASRPPSRAATPSACAAPGSGLRVTDAVSELTPFSGAFLFTDPSDDALVFTSLRDRTPLPGHRAQRRLGRRGLRGASGAATRSVVLGSDGAAWEAEVRRGDLATDHGLRRLDLRRGRRRQRGRLRPTTSRTSPPGATRAPRPRPSPPTCCGRRRSRRAVSSPASRC